jgi:hypothetical protein
MRECQTTKEREREEKRKESKQKDPVKTDDPLFFQKKRHCQEKNSVTKKKTWKQDWGDPGTRTRISGLYPEVTVTTLKDT